jgi:hypothetical protein
VLPEDAVQLSQVRNRYTVCVLPGPSLPESFAAVLSTLLIQKNLPMSKRYVAVKCINAQVTDARR